MKRILAVVVLLSGCGANGLPGPQKIPIPIPAGSRGSIGYQAEVYYWYRVLRTEVKDHPDIVLSRWASDPQGVYAPAENLPHWFASVKTHAYAPWFGEEDWLHGEITEKWVLTIPLVWYGPGQPTGHASIIWGWDLEQWGDNTPRVGAGYSLMSMFRGVGGSFEEKFVWPGDRFFPGAQIRRKWEGGFQETIPLTHREEIITRCVGTRSWVNVQGLTVDAASGLNQYNYTPNRLSVGITVYSEE